MAGGVGKRMTGTPGQMQQRWRTQSTGGDGRYHWDMENCVDQTQSQVGLLPNPAGSPQVILGVGTFYLENSCRPRSGTRLWSSWPDNCEHISTEGRRVDLEAGCQDVKHCRVASTSRFISLQVVSWGQTVLGWNRSRWERSAVDHHPIQCPGTFHEAERHEGFGFLQFPGQRGVG